MIRKITLFVFIVLLSHTSLFAQNSKSGDSINRVDDNNMKQGHWIITNEEKKYPNTIIERLNKLHEAKDEYTDKISKIDRPKYITYTSSRGGKLSYIIDSDTLILMGDGTQKVATELVAGDIIKTIDIKDLPIHERDYKTSEWTGSLSRLLSESDVSTTTVDTVTFVEETMIFTKITTTNGTVWSDLPTSEILVKEGDDTIKFKHLSEFSVGEEIVFLNIQSETFIVDTISSIEYEFKTITIGEIDVEPLDVFLPILDGGIAMIQHNACKTSLCSTQSPCPNYNVLACNTCTPSQCAAK